MHRTALTGRLGLAVAALVLGGCSFEFNFGGDAASGAEDLIEGELADELGLTDMSATCDDPVDESPGTAFTCTSTSEVGEIRWTAVIGEDDVVNVDSVNLVTADDLAGIEVAAVDLIEAQAGRTLGYENFDCGDGPVAVGTDNTFDCELTDPDNGDIYDATIEITDFQAGSFQVEVADEPRG